MKPKSTNPFDSDSSADEPEENFYDCLEKDEQKKEAASPRVRSAVLNFDKPFDDVEQPALKFDQIPSAGSSDFFSPLENAMMQFGSSPMERNTSATDDDTDAESPIVNSHATGYSSLSASPGSTKRGSKIPSEISTEGLNARDGKRRSNSKRKLVVNSKPNAIMTELLSGENEFHIDYKSILLEDLGTASSWLILLLPYFAFIITLLLESSKTLQVSSIGPLSAAIPCDEDMVVKALGPCHFSSRAIFEQDDFDTSDKLHVSYDGTAFESGNIHNIPVLSTYLYGDAIFENLSTHAVAIVAQGMLESSVKVMQRNSVHLEGENEWTLMFSSNPRKVSMTCRKEGTFSSKTSWNCKTPRILDVVFSMPETAVYGGGDVRIVISYSFKQVVLDQKDASHVYTKTKDTAELFSAIQTEHTSSLVEEIVTSSSYTFEHMSPIEMKLDTGVRLFTFVITFVFIVYWCYSINTKGRKQGGFALHALKKNESSTGSNLTSFHSHRGVMVGISLGFIPRKILYCWLDLRPSPGARACPCSHVLLPNAWF